MLEQEKREAWAEVIAKGKLGPVWWNGLRDRPVGVIILVNEQAKYVLRAKGDGQLELKPYSEGELT